MQISKWGNSLAIRLPKQVVDGLALKAGDEVEITLASDRHFLIERDTSRQQAIARMRALRQSLPKGFRFDRADSHER